MLCIGACLQDIFITKSCIRVCILMSSNYKHSSCWILFSTVELSRLNLKYVLSIFMYSSLVIQSVIDETSMSEEERKGFQKVELRVWSARALFNRSCLQHSLFYPEHFEFKREGKGMLQHFALNVFSTVLLYATFNLSLRVSLIYCRYASVIQN
jgi:hypothetical protein